jgi:hypothetical protein
MKATTRRIANPVRAVTTLFICSLAALSAAQSAYRIGEDGASANAGPVRMARFDYMKGGVEWRPNEGQQWSPASRNLPIRQGAQIYAPDAARSEVQFDDGSDMRLGAGAVATLVTLYSDNQGEFTEVKLTNGLATFHLTNKNSLYQIDTPTGSIKSYGPADIRVGDTSGVEIACRAGTATYNCGCGQTETLQKGQYLNETSTQAQPVVGSLPAPDQWDNFNESRDQVVYQAPQYVPPNIGEVAGDINGSGTWQYDAQYGHVWCPRESAGWRPYSDGHWVFTDPIGWTWVGNESWGWAPYHYGTWVHADRGWGWCPGPAAQCWSPAVVDFSYYGGNVCWCPLAPGDVHYGLSVGLNIGGIGLGFSIGQVGCYYPVAGGFCEPRPWGNAYVNRYSSYNVNTINNYYGNRGFAAAWRTTNFTPRNAHFGAGSYVAANNFARGGGSFHAMDPKQASYFSRGKSFAMPARGSSQISGPFNVHPVASSFTPSHSFASHGPSAALLNRPVYRAPVPKFAARQTTGLGKSFAPPARPVTARNTAAVRPGTPTNAMNHGAANHFAPANANRAAAAAAAARKSVRTRPGNAAETNRNVGARPNKNRPTGSFNSAAAARNRAAANHNAAAAHNAASSRNHAMAAHTAAAPHTSGAAHKNAARANANHRAANTHRAAATHRAAVTHRAAATHRAAPARSAARATHSAPAHRAAPQRAAVHRVAPQRAAPQRSAPAPRRSFSAPSRPAPRTFSAPRPAAPRPAPQRSAPAPRAAPRGGGGDHKHGH